MSTEIQDVRVRMDTVDISVLLRVVYRELEGSFMVTEDHNILLKRADILGRSSPDARGVQGLEARAEVMV